MSRHKELPEAAGADLENAKGINPAAAAGKRLG